MLHKFKRTWVALLVIILVLTIGGITFVMSQDDNVIYGAYNKKSGMLRIISSPDEVRPAEELISWIRIEEYEVLVSRVAYLECLLGLNRVVEPIIKVSGSDDGYYWSDMWQSFTPHLQGDLTYFEEKTSYYDVNKSFTATIYSGEGTTGPIIHSETFAHPSQQFGWPKFTFSTPVPVVKGAVYTLRINNISGDGTLHFGANWSNPYTGGILHANPNWDVAKLYIYIDACLTN